VWHHHDHFPFPNPIPASNSCALAIASGSDKQSECCRTHRVIVIAMKSKGNNNKPIQKSCDYHNVATTEKIPLRWFVSVCHHTATSQFIRNEPDESTQIRKCLLMPLVICGAQTCW
jgi:hypothetical protein